jgi:HAD superfamily hydrolase (TIGR01549 family)
MSMNHSFRRLIGLDLDGTLEDSRDDMTASARRVRAQLTLPVRADAELRPYVNGGMEQLYRKCFDDYIGSHTSEAGAREETVRVAYEADYLANVAVQTRLYDGIAQALPELAKLGTLACITNKPEHISRRLLAQLGVGDLFATVVGGDSCPQNKPNPIMLREAVQRLGFDVATEGSKVFMIGDTAGDIKLARAFGAVSVWCAWGYTDAPGDDAPDHVAKGPGDLLQIVRG